MKSTKGRVLSSAVTEHVGKKVLMRGWAQTIRQHGKVAFVDLRDQDGLTQLVFTSDLLSEIASLTAESVIGVIGQVTKRPQSLVNPNIVSGEVEVQVENFEVYSRADALPMPLNERQVKEMTRLQYRYLDLRSLKMAENLKNRHRGNQFIRNWLTERGFTEVETPYISKSTPEGARDYLIPSRVEKGKFYALPQSPQQYKQLLIASGIEKYFQIVRSFRY